MVSDKNFVCPYGTVAERMGHLKYFYIENHDFSSLPSVLREFVNLSKENQYIRHAFVVFVEPESPEKSFAYYENYFWDILKYLHEHDDKEWNKNIAIDPEDPLWEFCFHDEPMFISVNMPAYKHRITRNLGNCLILIFQPRRIFNNIAYNSIRGKNALQLIRSRVESIENLPFHPDLGAYGDLSKREWKQYVITDDNKSRKGKCPFHPTK
ncbi:YqcI/YcgG family protein [Oceanobacillus salinisoli]|uniref:YqcI/YcgG family protein n=1 Tax=Oceanobacillus salinisoli TaxID=2678611 RepID=UPI001E59302E|nr:YqcI/YcgG family protein [Oceanobacillus salinisoli]